MNLMNDYSDGFISSHLIKQKILRSKILCFTRAVLKSELWHFSALFCFKT